MEYVFIWFALAVAVGMFAGQRGRGRGNWFLVSALLSPLLGFIFLMASKDLRLTPAQIDAANRVKCPACAELVMPEASVCKHCGAALTPDPAYSARMAAQRAQQADQAEAKGTLKAVAAIAVAAGVFYLWATRHGGGW